MPEKQAHFIGVFRAPNQRRALPCYSKQIMIQLPKLDVAGSNPVSRSKIPWISSLQPAFLWCEALDSVWLQDSLDRGRTRLRRSSVPYPFSSMFRDLPADEAGEDRAPHGE